MANDQPFEGSETDARDDWFSFAVDEAFDQAPPPPAALLRVVGEAAGGLPKGVTPRAALKASAALLQLLKGRDR